MSVKNAISKTTWHLVIVLHFRIYVHFIILRASKIPKMHCKFP